MRALHDRGRRPYLARRAGRRGAGGPGQPRDRRDRRDLGLLPAAPSTMNPLLDLDARPVIAHRGASGLAPENTIAAFELAVRRGADAFELDIQVTADGAPVVLHDDTLDRTTDRTGPVAPADAGGAARRGRRRAVHPRRRTHLPVPRDRRPRVPRWARCSGPSRAMPLLVEIKHAAAQEAVRRVLQQEDAAGALRGGRGGPGRAPSSSGTRPSPAPPRGPEIAALYRAALLRRRPPASDATAACRCRSVIGVSRCRRAGSSRVARELACPVHVWTVNSASAATRYWGRGAAGMVTNFPGLIRAARQG